LKRFPILLIEGIFYGDSVVTFADFTMFFALALLWNTYNLRRGLGSETYFAISSCSKRLG
jgi:hypothetical protein